MTPEELLKEVGEPTCRVSTTGIITNQTNAPLEPGLELYTADQLLAARKGLEEEIERLSERRCEICGYAEHHREHTSCLRTQLAAAQEQIQRMTRERLRTADAIESMHASHKDQLAKAEQRVAEACALACEDVIGNTANDQRMIAAIDCSAMICAGEWRKFVKEV